jgi:hypothetical protein
MADLKISQLTGATTPLAGTEVLPIVQSGATKKVATDDLTVKNVRSNATTGILQVAGPATAATRTMTVPDANFTAARIDAGQTFTGTQTVSGGDVVIATASKGIIGTASNGDIPITPNGTGVVVIGNGNSAKQQRIRTQKHTFYATKSITANTVFFEIDFGSEVGAAIVDIVASGTAPGNDNIRLCARYFCDKNSGGTVTATAIDIQGTTTMLSAVASGTKVQFTAEYIATVGNQNNFYGIEVLCVGGETAENIVTATLI